MMSGGGWERADKQMKQKDKLQPGKAQLADPDQIQI